MIPFYPIYGGVRPNRMVSAGQKGEDYHRDMARWLIGNINYQAINLFRAQGELNSNFFGGRQWTIKSDVDTFLMDGSEDTRNRLAVSINVIRPIMEKYRGTAGQMAFNAKAAATTSRSITRRQKKLAEVLSMQQFASTAKDIRAALKEVYPIGDTPDQSAAMFENWYQDALLKALNNLMQVVARNPYGSMSKGAEHDAFSLACYGACASIPVTSGSHKVWERVDMDTFLYDTTALEYDLSDAEFMGDAPLLSPSIIYERYQPTSDKVKIVEAVTTDNMDIYGGSRPQQTRSPRMTVFRMQWRDFAYYEMGWVLGQDGLPEQARINYLPSGSKPGTKPQYTDKDLIDPPDTPEVRKVYGDQKKRRAMMETARFCDMTPWEYMWGMSSGLQGGAQDLSQVPEQKRSDIVWDYGVHELQEVNPMDSSKILLPMKASVWAMNGDRIVAPITDIIMPQRFFNRVMSVTEQQINQAGARGAVLDRSALIVPGQDAAEAMRRMKRGEAIEVDSKGLGVANVVGYYDTTPSAGTQAYFGVMQQVISMVRLVSATPEPVTGTQMPDQLNGVTQMLIEQAGILDGPFYTALARLRTQQFQHTASAIRMYYLERPDVLKDMVSEEDFAVLAGSADASLERLLVTVERSNSRDIMRQQVDQVALTMLQIGALDMQSFTSVYGTGSMEDLLAIMRNYQRMLAQAQQEQQRQQVKAQMAQALSMRDQQLNEEANMAYESGVKATMEAAKNANKLEQIDARKEATIAIDDNAALNEMAAQAPVF